MRPFVRELQTVHLSELILSMSSLSSLIKRHKSPEQLVRLLREALSDPSAASNELQDEAITKRLCQIKMLLYGDENSDAKPEKCASLSVLLINQNLIPQIITKLHTIPFEARKHFAQIYNNLIRRDLAGFVMYVERDPFILHALMLGYENPDIALNCGSMMRESVRHEKLARNILYSDDLWKFFDYYVHYPNFEVASDAFATLKDLFIRHKELASQFFTAHYDQVFGKYDRLLISENYVTRRQSLKLLGEILLDRSNFDVMMKYIGEKEHLKLMMNLLRDTSANIQFEAFHVFKVFVANPKKPDTIAQILSNNRDKLIAYLRNFQNTKEDPQFVEEKALLIRTLEALEKGTQPLAASEDMQL
uniref:Calciumbinding protein putative n=1 Tax=Albugo laibachii Nc14 TaxID=890382 RepID=F0VZK7_9STRA|nr:calciumbinding protein putative [Albugo laibachii Nc14]|eukprot:CCA14237.1 calciumbinding protein putative [Albugo laibachii Nc14]